METYAFISRHTPTQEQHDLAEGFGIRLEHVGDMDAFQLCCDDVAALGDFDGVVVVHPAAALKLSKKYNVGIFENANRAPEGERPQFYAMALWFF